MLVAVSKRIQEAAYGYLVSPWVLPPRPDSAKLEASLKTDEERQMRARLVLELEQAAEASSSSGERLFPRVKDAVDEATTVLLTFEHKYLIEPELQWYNHCRGSIHLAQHDTCLHTIYTNGATRKSYKQRKEITEGLPLIEKDWWSRSHIVRDDIERLEVVRKAHTQGFHMAVIIKKK